MRSCLALTLNFFITPLPLLAPGLSAYRKSKPPTTATQTAPRMIFDTIGIVFPL
ncbi:hypothetical protein BX070DRAFT_229584 [Coemansia spiralis]|nr:hypothetical protein BX070DRAFT_229584 [Coemansia spiralis]